MESFKKILEEKVKSSKQASPLEAALVKRSFKEVIREIFDEEIARELEAIDLRRKVLTVRVSSSVMAQELHLREKEILNLLNQDFQAPAVYKLRFLF